MEHAVQIALIERVLAHLEAGTTDMVDHVAAVDVARYVAPERLARERDVLYRAYPLMVGRGAELRERGDFVTREVADLPVLLVRDEAGRARAFLNVCRHRGTRLVDEAEGRGRRAFVCPYHAWTYGLDGRLKAIPHEAGFPGVRARVGGLAELPCAERFGFLWVRPTPGGAPIDVDAWLGPVARDFAAFAWESHALYAPQWWRKAYNWKIAIDISLETYHIKKTHTGTIYPLFFDNLGLFDRFGPHLRNLFPKRSIADCRAKPRSDWRVREHANVLYAIFPNTVMLVQPDHVSVLHVYPDGTDACRVHTYTVVPEPPTERAARYWDANNAIFHGALAEDFHKGETAQRGLRSGANTHLTFGRFEQSLAWFHEAVDAALDGADAAGSEHAAAPVAERA